MSSVSSVRHALAEYLAGRVSAERVVAVVTEAYYGDGGRGNWEGLTAILEIVERAAPGVVALDGSAAPPGFDVTLAERPFPRAYEAELRRAAEAYLSEAPSRPPGLVRRVVAAIRRLFTASG